MLFEHYLIYEKCNDKNKWNKIFNATGVPDIILLISFVFHFSFNLECTVFCAAVHIFLCNLSKNCPSYLIN